MEIDWKIKRLDEGEERDPRDEGCLLKIDGKITNDAQDVGQLEA